MKRKYVKFSKTIFLFYLCLETRYTSHIKPDNPVTTMDDVPWLCQRGYGPRFHNRNGVSVIIVVNGGKGEVLVLGRRTKSFVL